MTSLTLRTKLISSFLLVALIPIAILGFLNERAIRKRLTEDANLRLSANASQTASTLNEFINDNLNAVRSEAKLPVFTDYLLVHSDARTGSPEEASVVASLHALSLKDFVNISSYALLDLRGMNLIDTYGADIGLDKSEFDYFRNPLQTGLPNVSAMEVAPEPFGETGLYFSAPVRDAKGNIIGVLASRYRSAFLQRLIADHNGLAGESSFAILLDENHVRLAHGADPGQVFKSVVPLGTVRIAQLQAKMRLPKWDVTDLTTDYPSFEKGLVNASNDPYFQASIGVAGSLHFAAVTGMQKLPWLVVYTQPQNTFLAPVHAHTRNTVLVGIVITVLVVIAALGVAQLLSGPITRLTTVANKISTGDLTARVTVEASDEIGSLATTLNTMTQHLEEHILELRTSEEQFRTICEFVPIMINSFDNKGCCTLWNMECEKTLEWSRNEIISNEDPLLLFYPDPMVRDNVLESIRHSDGVFREYVVKSNNGSDRLQLWANIRLPNGTIMGVGYDITARKQIELALQESEKKYRTLVETTDTGYVIIDQEGQVIDANSKYVTLSGYKSFGEIQGHCCAEWTAPYDQERSTTEFIKCRESGYINNVEIDYIYSNDTIMTIEINAALFDTDTGPAIMGLCRDVSERKRIQKEREQLIQELEAKNTEMERFTYTVSHDLKSPLVTINGFLGLLKKDITAHDFKRIDSDLKRIHSATENMEQLLEELLELSRIGRVVNAPQAVSLSKLAQDVVGLITSRIAKKQVEITISPDLPIIYGDGMRFREVLQNLMINAIKFMGDQPQPRIEVGVVAEKDKGTVCYIRDNGIGIDPRYHEKVFGLFERLGQNQEGSGIGLAIVKRIIEVHKGNIWVESEGQGKGCTFYFTVPERSEVVSS